MYLSTAQKRQALPAMTKRCYTSWNPNTPGTGFEHLVVPNLVASTPAVDKDDRTPGTAILLEYPHGGLNFQIRHLTPFPFRLTLDNHP
jgi:hypothetical protein